MASWLSSPTALERTATGGESSPSAAYPSVISARTASGTGANRIASLIAWEARPIASTSPAETPPRAEAIRSVRPASSTNVWNASVDSANPGGTGISAASNSPRFALLPPNCGSSPRESCSSGRTNCGVTYPS